jgi:uncharacterized integral membrane protein (TIGR00698 family)
MNETLPKSRWWKNEDWLAVGIGFVVIALVVLGLRLNPPAFHWATDAQFASAVRKDGKLHERIDKATRTAKADGATNLLAVLVQLRKACDNGERTAVTDAARELELAAKPQQTERVQKAVSAVAELLNKSPNTLSKIFSAANLSRSAQIAVGYLVLSMVAMRLMGAPLQRFVAGFPVVFTLAWISQMIAGNIRINDLGLEYVIFALVLGLVLNHVFVLPGWLREAVRTEFYIKSGLVILGSGILFAEIMQAGFWGLIQAVLVVLVVWYFCFWLSRKLRVDDEFATMLSTAVSICGVSAAIAACGAIQGDKKKLSYVTSLVLIVAVPMMILMPWIVKTTGMPDIVGGAWLGGTLDTSGSVVAAGALISEAAMKTGVIVKFSQNVLIGVAAFILSIWWTMRKGTEGVERPSAKVIWERFPKFVLGFMAASLVFSFLLSASLVKDVKPVLTGLRNFWFALAFVSIGLETRLTELVRMENGRPAFAFIGAQAFNVVWTLILAWLLFGGVFFSAPAMK